MALWYYGWEFTQTDTTFPSYVLSSVQWIHPFLSRFIPKNKLLASVPCFQKIHLLFTNDLYFLTITCRPSRSFFRFPFCFIFIYSQNYTPMVLYEEIFLCISTLLYMTNFFCIRIGTLSLYITRSIYKTLFTFKDFFCFSQHTPMVHTKVSLYTFVAHTHKNFSPRITCTHKKPSIHIFLLLCIRRHFIHNASFFLLGFLVHFIFRTTFLNEKLYTVSEFQQTLLTTMKQVPT